MMSCRNTTSKWNLGGVRFSIRVAELARHISPIIGIEVNTIKDLGHPHPPSDGEENDIRYRILIRTIQLGE
jgi:hypothetical protein